MKKSIYLLMLLAVVAGGCKKQLDQQPVSSLSTTNFFTNNNDFLQGLNGVYTKLEAYPDQLMFLEEMRSDNIDAISDGTRDWDGINDFYPNITAVGYLETAWTNNFNGVYNANAVLDALGTKGSNIGDTSLETRYTAECKFLRAFYYFQLTRLFGGVPLITKPLTAAEVSTIGRSSVASVDSLIIDDLNFAAANLPASYTGANLGRATSYAAEGLLGLVYLTRSGPTYGVNGPGLNSGEWGKALALFNNIINSGAFSFASDYTSIFSYTNEHNSEVIFDVEYASSIDGASFPSDLVPVTYWTSLGISNTYGNGLGTSTFTVSNNLVNSYTAGGTDSRYAFNIATAYTVGPFIKKYIDYSHKGTSGTDWPINFIVQRYTDILMMKAECILNGAGSGTQADVDAIVNQVRARAGLGPLTNVDLPALMEERRREFVGEGLRWNDLVREGLAVTTMNAWITSDGLTNIDVVVPDYIIYPVPATEMQTKPGLYTQNLGYE